MEEAVRLGLEALALTDHNGFYGVVRFAEAARRLGLPTVFGAELTLGADAPRAGADGVPDPGGAHLLVLARSPEGYARLARAISGAQMAGRKAQPRLSLDELSDLGGVGTAGEGHWLVLTGCRKGLVPAALVRGGAGGGRVAASTTWSPASAPSRWRSSCGTTATRSTPPATTPSPTWPCAGGAAGGHQQRALRHARPA